MLQKSALGLLWRYKVFFLIGLVIVLAQVFLAYKLLRIPLSTSESKAERELNRKLYQKLVNDDATSNRNTRDPGATQKEKAPPRGVTKRSEPEQLRLSELSFVPPCHLTKKETVSAIHRAKSQTCKATIVEVACGILEGVYYPKRLPNYCPRGTHVPGQALGCFPDEFKNRILPKYQANFKETNSPTRCIQLCLQSGYPYAGVQYAYECFCGDYAPDLSTKMPDSRCNMKCPGDPKEACGGNLAMNVYETGIRKFESQPTELTPKEGEEPVRIVYLLTLTGRAVRQVHRLLKAIYDRRHYYYIHIDARQEYMFRELVKLEAKFPNIRLSRNRFSTIWGGATLLQMLLSSVRQLLAMEWHWDFVLNLSESDFPLKTVDQLTTLLTANRNKNFVRNHGREVQRFIEKQGLDQTFVECDNHMWRIGDRVLPAGVTIDGGSDWICLSRDFARYVADRDNYDDLVWGFIRVFDNTILSAESFFHTTLRNSRYCELYVNNNLRMTNWKRQLGCKCQYKHIVDWCGCSPNNYKPHDWDRLRDSEHKQLFFARKFEPIINQAIILQLEEWIFGPYPADYPHLHSYWQNLYHHNDLTVPVDGALLNVAYSILRVNSHSNVDQFYEPLRVQEITHFVESDLYRGFLIRHEATIDGVPVLLETWVEPLLTTKIIHGPVFNKRLKHLEVSTDYDEKEQLSRNFQRIISSNAVPALIFRLSPGDSKANATSCQLSVEWIDPTGEVVNTSNFTIEDNPGGAAHTFNHFHRATELRRPLQPGLWIARLLKGKTSLAVTQFLVTSATFVEPVTIRDLSQRHTHDAVLSLKRTAATSSVQVKNSNNETHSNTFGGEQHRPEQLDRLVPLFFSIKDTCRIGEQPMGSETDRNDDPSDVQFVDCAGTSWSSVAPDPKSNIDLLGRV